MNEIKELKNDLSVFFKWHSLQVKMGIAVHHKNCAIKQQDFEAAVIYRKEEVEIFSELAKVNDELIKVSEKYNGSTTTK